jgi:HSP20 family molecular chaperone IbpA
MSSQAGAVTAREFPTTIPINHENRRVVDSLKQKVARRAYELFERGGRAEGNDMRHWLQAESEILSKIPEIRETSSSYTVNVPVQGFKPDEIYVGVDANRTLVLAETQDTADGRSKSPQPGFSREALFLAADWPAPVDPATASAQIKNGNLILTVKRAVPLATS